MIFFMRMIFARYRSTTLLYHFSLAKWSLSNDLLDGRPAPTASGSDGALTVTAGVDVYPVEDMLSPLTMILPDAPGLDRVLELAGKGC